MNNGVLNRREYRQGTAGRDPAPDALPQCPRCRTQRVAELGRESDAFNLCFRCRDCGHVFSPKKLHGQGGPNGQGGLYRGVQG